MMALPHKLGGHGPREGPFIMLYLRFARVALNQWDVITPVKSTKPIARVKQRRNGQCSAIVAPDHALNREELAALSCFMQERERA